MTFRHQWKAWMCKYNIYFKVTLMIYSTQILKSPKDIMKYIMFDFFFCLFCFLELYLALFGAPLAALPE